MLYFTKNNKEEFSLLYWVLTARDAKATRCFRNSCFENLFADKENIVCTNAALMHLVKQTDNFKIEPGQYTINKFSKSDIILTKMEEEEKTPFVNYNAVIPKNMEIFKQLEKSVKKDSNFGISRAVSDIYKDSPGMYLNLNYLELIFDDVFSDYDEFTVKYDPENIHVPVVFESGVKKAILAQIKRND